MIVNAPPASCALNFASGGLLVESRRARPEEDVSVAGGRGRGVKCMVWVTSLGEGRSEAREAEAGVGVGVGRSTVRSRSESTVWSGSAAPGSGGRPQVGQTRGAELASAGSHECPNEHLRRVIMQHPARSDIHRQRYGHYRPGSLLTQGKRLMTGTGGAFRLCALRGQFDRGRTRWIF